MWLSRWPRWHGKRQQSAAECCDAVHAHTAMRRCARRWAATTWTARTWRYRVVADHIRTLCFAIADGAAPGNDGRNYVLRRILRRAVRYGQDVLGAKEGFFVHLVDAVVANFGGFYPELVSERPRIVEIIQCASSHLHSVDILLH